MESTVDAVPYLISLYVYRGIREGVVLMITPLRGVDDWTFVFSSEKIFVHARYA